MLRLVQRTAEMHKLSPPWEGPFIVSRALMNDSYYLIDARKEMPNRRIGPERRAKAMECSFALSILLIRI